MRRNEAMATASGVAAGSLATGEAAGKKEREVEGEGGALLVYYGDNPADDTKLLDPAAPTTSKGKATVNFAANYK